LAIGFGSETNDMWLTAGFSPSSKTISEFSMSGTGCSVRVPNTASLAANLFEQSWVPELKCLRAPSWRMKFPNDGP
jgi:hypothetical protein